MILLIPTAVFLVGAVAILILRRARPESPYEWLLTAGAAALAWLSLIAVGLLVPRVVYQEAWRPQALFTGLLRFQLDDTAWVYGTAVGTLALAAILVDVARAPTADWLGRATVLAGAAVGVLAVGAGNLFTLLVLWGVLDFFVAALLLHLTRNRAGAGFIHAFGWRALSAFLVVAGGILSLGAVASPVAGANPLAEPMVLFLMAVALRLAAWPSWEQALDGRARRRSLETFMRFASVASALALGSRLGFGGTVGEATFTSVLVAGLVPTLYCGWMWLRVRDSLDGMPYWILGVGLLASIPSLTGQPQISLPIGLILVLTGGSVLLFRASHRWSAAIPLLAILASTGLVGTPAWVGMRWYAPPRSPWSYPYLLVHAGLLAGAAVHVWRSKDPASRDRERWERAIIPLGQALPVVVFLLLAFRTWRWPLQSGLSPWWPGIVVVALFAAGIYLARRLELPEGSAGPARAETALFSGFLELVRPLFERSRRVIGFLNQMLEGEGGMLWALLLLALLLSLLVEGNRGGSLNGF